MSEWKHGIAVVALDNDAKANYEPIAQIDGQNVYHIVFFKHDPTDDDYDRVWKDLQDDFDIGIDFELIAAPNDLVERYVPEIEESEREALEIEEAHNGSRH